MPIIDDLAMLTVGMQPPKRPGGEMGAANEDVETIGVGAPSWGLIKCDEHVAQGEAARDATAAHRPSRGWDVQTLSRRIRRSPTSGRRGTERRIGVCAKPTNWARCS